MAKRGYAKLKPRVEIDKAVMGKIRDRLNKIKIKVKKQDVAVGVRDGKKHDYYGNETAVSIAQVAAAHEFGLGVPERSFLRKWFDENKTRNEKQMTAAMKLMYLGDLGAVSRLSQNWAREIRDSLEDGTAKLKPLEADTKKARERAGLNEGPPLYATGELADSISAVVNGRILKP